MGECFWWWWLIGRRPIGELTLTTLQLLGIASQSGYFNLLRLWIFVRMKEPLNFIYMKKLTDQELYRKAKYYGKNALLWRRKFIGLLPEISKRKLYERKGFSSIFEFAFKLAGLSEQQVRTALNLEERFTNLPILKSLLEKGEVSVNKLVRIQSIATSKNESELAEAVSVLPQSAIEALVRDENGLNKPKNEAKSLRAQDLNLSDEVTARLLQLQEKGIDINQELLQFLNRREQEIEQEKEEISKNLQEAKSRYIPAKTREIIKKEFGEKCSITTCKKPAEHLHHTQTFALSSRHDPHYLAPLCKNHHTIAHAINVKVQDRRQRLS